MTKKKVAILVSVALAATLTVGGTLALLNKTTQTVTNVFASNRTLANNIKLREPAWDGYDFDEVNSKKEDPVGDEAESDDKNLGFNEAKNYLPGDTIAKDPTVKNVGGDVAAYVALNVKYKAVTDFGDYKAGDYLTYDEFKKAYLQSAGLTFDKDWLAYTSTKDGASGSVFVYGTSGAATKLDVNAVTSALFSSVPVSFNLTEPLPKFDIEVTAYAIQADNITPSDAVALVGDYAATGTTPTK